MSGRRRVLDWVFALAACVVLLSTTRASAAGATCYALVVGNDRGDHDDVERRRAETDAQRIYDVLQDLGRFEPGDEWCSFEAKTRRGPNRRSSP